MPLDLKNEQVFDLAIIGGGIAGTAIARDASMRGISVLLFEMNELGSGTSSKSSKLIHGGLRYLELSWNALTRGDFAESWKNVRFVFSALRECAVLERIAPDLVKPISLLIPIYARDARQPITVYLGTFFYGFLSVLAGKGRLPKFFFSKRSVLEKLPGLNPDGLKGGVLIWDHTTDDQELVRRTASSAKKNSAQIFEKTKVQKTEYFFEKNIYKITVQGEAPSKEFFAHRILNASGPWVDKTRKLLGEYEEDYLVPVAGSHLELKPFLPVSVILQAPDKRLFFVINRDGAARVGTTEWICKDPDELKPAEADKDYLLGALSFYFPEKKFTASDILRTDAGIRPLARPKTHQSEHDISREHEIRVSKSGIIHVLGVKLTDHRRAAQEIVDELIPELRRFKPGIRLKTETQKIKL